MRARELHGRTRELHGRARELRHHAPRPPRHVRLAGRCRRLLHASPSYEIIKSAWAANKEAW
jgi:hypothetical protein